MHGVQDSSMVSGISRRELPHRRCATRSTSEAAKSYLLVQVISRIAGLHRWARWEFLTRAECDRWTLSPATSSASQRLVARNRYSSVVGKVLSRCASWDFGWSQQLGAWALLSM